MTETALRLTRPGLPPDHSEIADWLGAEAWEFWQALASFIEQNYPGVFVPEWLFGGKKHGWALRYKKSKSFCSFVPEQNRFALLIVFGAEERAQVELIKDQLSVPTRTIYDAATTYHDGKWALFAVDSATVIGDVKLLLAVKRESKIKKSATGV